MMRILSSLLIGMVLGLGAAGVQAQMQTNGCGPGGQLGSGASAADFGGSCYYPAGVCLSHPAGQVPPDCIDRWRQMGLWEKSENKAESSGGRKPPPRLPSKWGAVAWNDQTGNYDTSLGERSKAEAIKLALNRCGVGCKTISIYANQCVAIAIGPHPEGKGYLRRIGLNPAQPQAEQEALSLCNAETKNCQLLFTECSLP